MTRSRDMSEQLATVIARFRENGQAVTGGPTNYDTRCPNHDDQTASLSFRDGNAGVTFNCHAGCDQDEMFETVADFLGMAPREFFYEQWAAPPEGPVATVAELAEAKHLPLDLLAWAGLVDSPQGVLMPYGNGRVRIRRELTGSSRFLWQIGEAKITAYGAWALDRYRAGGTIFLAEGETDVLTGLHYGLPVMGIPGKHMARAVFREHPYLVTGILEIFVIEELDDLVKHAFLKSVREGLSDVAWRGELYPMRLPVKDLNELHVMVGPDGFMPAFEAAYEAAVDAPTWPDPAPIPHTAVEVAEVICRADFPQTFKVQDVRNRLRGMTSMAIRSALRHLKHSNIVRRITSPRKRGRPTESFKTNPKVRA
jgi:hypothetical protein